MLKFNHTILLKSQKNLSLILYYLFFYYLTLLFHLFAKIWGSNRNYIKLYEN